MELGKKIINGDYPSLSKGITLIESKLDIHRREANELISFCKGHVNKSIRVGITGVPGVGKSTLIESIGEILTNSGKKIAVLAIDPSSEKTHGSILGDKSRMHKLAANKNAFIRPSPSSGTLGGVNNTTRESILLCEAAGFDVIIVETVGVGQSEITVSNLVDFCLLLILTGAGDELQGIKRGIMEVADSIVITKADGTNANNAKRAAMQYKRALHLFPEKENGWKPIVMSCSAKDKNDVNKICQTINKYQEQMITNGHLIENRKTQNIYWLHKQIKEQLGIKKYQEMKENKAFRMLEKQLADGSTISDLIDTI